MMEPVRHPNDGVCNRSGVLPVLRPSPICVVCLAIAGLALLVLIEIVPPSGWLRDGRRDRTLSNMATLEDSIRILALDSPRVQFSDMDSFKKAWANRYPGGGDAVLSWFSDGWKSPIALERPTNAQADGLTYLLRSAGPDRIMGTDDDVTRLFEVRTSPFE